MRGEGEEEGEEEGERRRGEGKGERGKREEEGEEGEEKGEGREESYHMTKLACRKVGADMGMVASAMLPSVRKR